MIDAVSKKEETLNDKIRYSSRGSSTSLESRPLHKKFNFMQTPGLDNLSLLSRPQKITIYRFHLLKSRDLYRRDIYVSQQNLESIILKSE